MASRRGDTFDKRQRERRRQEKAAGKRARRQGQPAPSGPTETVRSRGPMTSAEFEAMEKFKILKEHHRAGGIDDETFEVMRDDIFADVDMPIPD